MTTPENPQIHLGENQWVCLARIHEGKRQLLYHVEQNKIMSFPSEAAALQFMRAENWSDEEIAETYFEPVEDI